MNTSLTRITGFESSCGDGDALDALIDFYHAFNTKHLPRLATNWVEGEAPSMDNPIGGIRRGWPAIAGTYAKLFDGPATVRVSFHDFTSQGGDDWHLFAGREQGMCETPAGAMALRIRTTRWFVRIGGAWRQLHHHGSIEEPGMLAAYQRMIIGAPLEQPA